MTTAVQRLLALVLFATCVAGVQPSEVQAQQSEPVGQSFITPFPEGDTYRVLVFGDWLAEGMIGGLAEALQGDQRTQIQRKVRTINGLSKPEAEEELRALEEQIAREPMHIAIVFVGGADRISFRAPNGKRIAVGSEEWRAEYGRRADRLMKLLKRRNVAVYWVGQPILRKPEANDDVQAMNEVMRERANLNGQRFVDIYDGFADEGGNYSAHGPDISGKIRALRASDGVSFTPDGYRKVAHFVERELKRDLSQARSERNIPLAGAEVEQRKINPNKVAVAARAPQQPATPQAGMATKGGGRDAARSWATTLAPASPAAASAVAAPVAGAEQRADNGRVTLRTINANGREELVTLDILRPAIPSAVLALLTKKETADKATAMGDTLPETIAGGLLVLNSVTTSAESGGRRGRRSPTQTAYYRVLVKGDRMPPRPGRLDDHRWPRQDEVAEAAPAAPPARSPVPRAGETANPATKTPPAKAQPRS